VSSKRLVRRHNRVERLAVEPDYHRRRRGELCALRWNRVDFATGVLDVRSSIAQTNSRVWEKDTKTHQRRRIVLDAQTLALLRAYLQH
jgi:integrase